MNNMIIGTHDSATGEKPKDFISWLVTPFAKTQTLTIRMQFLNGCRWFDFRVKPIHGLWYCAHGLWKSKRTITSILAELNELAESTPEKVYYSITYEGKLEENSIRRAEFIDFVYMIWEKYENIILTGVSVKLPKWTNLPFAVEPTPYPLIHLFKTLDYSSWHTYFPCPWFWNLFYRDEPKEGYTNLYDFLPNKLTIK